MSNSSIDNLLVGGGKVLQVVSTTLTSTTSTSSASTSTFADLGLSATITPSSSSSKIMVMVAMTTSASTGIVHTQLVRGATPLSIGDAAGTNRVRSSQSCRAVSTYYILGNLPYIVNFLDSPATTSATTYKIQGTLGSTYSGTIYLNRVPSDADFDYCPRSTSSITLIEIGA
jgi:hypothetical protein